MHIKGFQRTTTKHKQFVGADQVSTNYYRSNFYNDWGNKLESLTNLDGVFSLQIEKSWDDFFWSIYEVKLQKNKNFVAKFEKLNEVKVFLKNKYKVAY